MKRAKNKSTLYDHLGPILETGSEDEIATARQQYWRQYKASWRKAKRKKDKEFTISFNDTELKTISKFANRHNRSCTRFIKESALAYCDKEFLVPDTTTLNSIRELLALNYNALQQLSDDDLLPEKKANVCLERIADLEKNVLKILLNPKPVERPENLSE